MKTLSAFRLVAWSSLGLLLASGAAYPASNSPVPEEGGEPINVPSAELSERFGIELQALRLSAAGHMLDLRYQVTDSDKAEPLMAQWKPYLVDESSGRKLSTPSFAKVGALRQSPEKLEEGLIYFVLFANPGRSLGHGDRVTVSLDGVHVEGVPIQ
ncbi:hypothetical protein [Thiohalomonas denitrificans]|uniref:hypothetical protein n=1 Tax=Thiohalomonas denitrificans TaxID=415747 RepID=UPI0026F0A029|nr:hypothetical protein [Thiohalomonas denitrificans]